MSMLSWALTWAFHLCLPPFLVILSLVLFLASFGKSLGIGRLYVKMLLHVFEFARKITAEVTIKKRKNSSKFILGHDSDGDEEEAKETTKENIEQEKLRSEEEEESHASEGLDEAADELSEISNRRKYLKQYGKESRHNVISRKDNLILTPDKPSTTTDVKKDHSTWAEKVLAGKDLSAETFQREFELGDVFDYIKTGIASVIEDEVTQRFVAEELKSWNLLTRTGQSFEFVNIRLTVIWIIGFFVRYFVLLPGRTVILVVGLLWMAICMAFVGQLSEGEYKRELHYRVYTSCFQLLGGSLSAVITYHNPENKPVRGICVANHTSPIDVLILACDNAYALIGQRHGGLLGKFQTILSKCADHIWFERSESKDRAKIASRLREHVEDPNKLPILIFPEGTCINNTSVMQFKKGSFEVGGTIYPVAIKYDPKFGDAFWNSSEYGMLHYIYMMMTSWAIVCDVWYLPPMTRRENEDAVSFANRVKAEIARQGGLVDLMWDGNLKRMEVKSEWKEKQQEEFSKRLKVD